MRKYSTLMKRELAERAQAHFEGWKHKGGREVQVQPGNSMKDELRFTCWFRADPTTIRTFTMPCKELEEQMDLMFEQIRRNLPLAGGFFAKLKGG